MTRKTPWLLALTLVLTTAPGARAQEEEEETGWSSRAEVSLVATGGNTETETVSLRAGAARAWSGAELSLEAGGLRAETTTETRFATLSDAGQLTVSEIARSELTAENFFLRGEYRRDLSERLFWFVGAGWNRNEFNGIENRYYGKAGVGNVWIDDESTHFRTDYGLTLTREEAVVSAAGGDEADTFLGARLSYLFERQLTETTGFVSELGFDQNLDETSDYRADFVNSISVAMSQRLALRVALQLLYDAEPSLEAVPLTTPGGESTLLLPLDELDSVLTVALVVDF